MGQDKAQLRLRGKTLLSHVRLAARRAGLPVRLIRRDVVWGRGPLGGVYTALRTARRAAVLFLACDMPFVSPELISRVVAELANGAAAFVRTDSVGFPFVLHASTLAEVEKVMNAKDCSLRALAARLGAKELRLRGAELRAVQNLNTPEEYARALQRLSKDRNRV